MGADMILAIVEYPKDFDQVRKRIDRLTHEALWQLSDMVYGWDRFYIEDNYDNPGDAAEEMRILLHEALDLLASPPRDVSTHELNGVEYAFTGGPTSGGDPTDSYQSLLLLMEANITGAIDPLGRKLHE